MGVTTPKDRDISILNYIIRNPEMFFEYQDRLREIHFRYDPVKIIFPYILSLFNSSGVMPTQVELEWKIQSDSRWQGSSVIQQEAVSRVLKTIYEAPVTEATGGLLAEFITARELSLLSQAIEDNKDITNLSKLVSEYKEKLESLEILNSGTNADRVVFPLSSGSIENFSTILTQELGNGVIPSPYAKYNARSRGGFHRGEETIIMASTNVGKTTTMFSLAYDLAVGSNARVIYYLCDGTMDEGFERTFVRAANKALTESFTLDDLAKEVADRVEPTHNLVLRVFPAASITPQDIFRDYRRVKYALKAETGDDRVDVVIVDYGDQLLPRRHKSEKRHELAEIFTDLAGFAQKEQIHVITATQANRDALRRRIVTLENMSEAYAKSHPAANVLALCQSSAEYHLGQFRLAVLKQRRGIKNYIIPMKVHYDRQLVIENPEFEGVLFITDDDNGSMPRQATQVETAPSIAEARNAIANMVRGVPGDE